MVHLPDGTCFPFIVYVLSAPLLRNTQTVSRMAKGITELVFNGTLAGVAPGDSLGNFPNERLVPVNNPGDGNPKRYHYVHDNITFELEAEETTIKNFRLIFDRADGKKYTLQRNQGEACFSLSVRSSFTEFVQFLNDLKINWAMDLDSIGPKMIGIRLESGTIIRYAFEDTFFGFYELLR